MFSLELQRYRVNSKSVPIDAELRRLIDPQLWPILDVWPSRDLDDRSLLEMRANIAARPSSIDPQGPTVHECFIPGPFDNPRLRVLIIDPAPGTVHRPAILHVHGGGFVAGSPEMSRGLLQKTALESRCLIVSVDYRLAPETRHPGALHDTFAALQWLHSEAPILGVDPARVAVMGESAGGGHAAALAIHARNLGGPPIAFQALIYPMLDDRTGSTRPASGFAGRYIWTAQNNAFRWTALLGVAAGSTQVPIDAVPARATQLAGLPPTWIGTAAFDLFLDENLEFTKRLIADGVPTELHVAPATFHGFYHMAPDADVSKLLGNQLMIALRRSLAPVPA